MKYLIAINPKIGEYETGCEEQMELYLRYLEKLRAEGLLKRVGPAKGGHWEIIGEAG